MTSAVLRISGAGTYAQVVQSKLPFSTLEAGEVVLRSRLGTDAPLNEHLVSLWGFAKNERRVLKSSVASGATITCECVVPKGAVRISPNAAEMLHLLGAHLVLGLK